MEQNTNVAKYKCNKVTNDKKMGQNEKDKIQKNKKQKLQNPVR